MKTANMEKLDLSTISYICICNLLVIYFNQVLKNHAACHQANNPDFYVTTGYAHYSCMT